jgi:hypothetical protein
LKRIQIHIKVYNKVVFKSLDLPLLNHLNIVYDPHVNDDLVANVCTAKLPALNWLSLTYADCSWTTSEPSTITGLSGLKSGIPQAFVLLCVAFLPFAGGRDSRRHRQVPHAFPQRASIRGLSASYGTFRCSHASFKRVKARRAGYVPFIAYF